MAWNYYFNMEVLALEVAEQHIQNMTEDNYYMIDDYVKDIKEEALYNNIKNGFVVITQLNCYVESFLNTIIDRCKEYDESLMGKSIEDKLVVLFLERKEILAAIKKKHHYEEYNTSRKLRNQMIHYKKALIGEGTLFPDFKLAGMFLPEYFVKSKMQEVHKCHVLFCEDIAKGLGLQIYPDIKVFEVEARDGLTSYVFDPMKTDVDPGRLG